MPEIDIRVVPPASFGDVCCDALTAAAATLERPVAGLATGATPIPLYEVLRKRVAAGTVDISAWRPFAVDEYVCARGDRCANRAFFAAHWGTIAGAPPVVQFEPEAGDLDGEARRFARLLGGAGGLDIAVLGIGVNGHLAFNEPGSGRASVTRVMNLAPESRRSAARCFADAPTRGLTLGLRELLAARRILLLADGAHKAGIVRRALEGPVGPACPASFVREHAGLTVVLDEPAAAKLSR